MGCKVAKNGFASDAIDSWEPSTLVKRDVAHRVMLRLNACGEVRLHFNCGDRAWGLQSGVSNLSARDGSYWVPTYALTPSMVKRVARGMALKERPIG